MRELSARLPSATSPQLGHVHELEIAVVGRPVMNAKEIMLDYGDYFTILLIGISGIFVNNPPLSS